MSVLNESPIFPESDSHSETLDISYGDEEIPIYDLNLSKTVLEAFNNRSKSSTDVAASIANDVSSYDNCKLAGRMVIYDIVKRSKSFLSYLNLIGFRLNRDILSFMYTHSYDIQNMLDLTIHLNYKYHDFFSATTIAKAYLLKPTFGEPSCETPCQKNMRIAVQFYHKQGIKRVFKCYIELCEGYYIPASPTIFNAGTKTCQMSSCFLIQIGDNLDSILYTGVGDAGMISRHNGGLGLGIMRLRHSQIADVGMSSGIIPACRVYDKVVKYVDQGGKRDGAATVFLPIWHIDFADFVNATDNYGNHELRFSTLNTCIWLNRLFFKRAEKKEKWTVFCPAKANELVGKYNYEFEKIYIEMEKLAEIRENELTNAVNNLAICRKELFDNAECPEIRAKYSKAVEMKVYASKHRIEHITYPDASVLLNNIIDMQTKSGMPYMMNGDSVNYKCNQKNMGSIDSSNLCLEITERSTPDKIASCNLASINMARFTTNKCIQNGTTYDEMAIDICNSYDFDTLAIMAGSIVENLNEVINSNYYPLDIKNDDGTINRGKISSLNLQTRPQGIGVSGYDDAVKIMDLFYDSKHSRFFNRMFFACLYYNTMLKSLELSLKHGEYGEFRTGSYNRFNGDGTFTEVNGSPLSNGQFQFDLWKEEADMLKFNGDLDERIYNREMDNPIDPKMWGQSVTELTDDQGNYIIVEPTWDSLRLNVMKYGVHNSLLIALMPTATVAQMLCNAESTECHNGNIYVRNVASGTFMVCNKHMIKDCEDIGIWNTKLISFIQVCNGSFKHVMEFINDHPHYFPSVFDKCDKTGDLNLNPDIRERLRYLKMKHRTMCEMSQKTMMEMARERGIYVCQSQSLNLYFADPDANKLRASHSAAIKLGLKTGMYYLRQEPNTNTGSFTMDPEVLTYYNEKIKNKIQSPIVPSCTIAMKKKGECLSCS